MAPPPSALSRAPAARSRTAWRGAPRLPAGIALIVVCLFGMVVLPHWFAGKSVEMRYELRETLMPLDVTLERLHREVLGSANRLQSYLVTGERRFATTFETETAVVRRDFARARALVETSDLRQADGVRPDLDEAGRVYADWLEYARGSLAFRAREGDPAGIAERSRAGQARLERFSTSIGKVGERVRAQEGALRDQLAEFRRLEQLLVLVLGSLAGIVVGYLTWLAMALLRAQRLALDERDQLEAVLASVDSGILLLDRDLRVAVCNERAAELLGIAPSTLVGADHRRLVREQVEPRAADPRAYAKRVDFLYENPDSVSEDLVEIARPEPRTLSRYSAPVRDESGETLARIEVYRDVTETLRRERELAEANERKDRFVATLSHELRTPLTPILGWIELLRDEREPERIRQGLAAIGRNVQLEAQLVEDLLDLSKVVNQKLELHFGHVDIASAVESALDTVRHLADAKGVLLETRLPGEPVAAIVDETRFIQVVWNLLSNAIKFTTPGKRVTLSAEAAESRLRVVVEDEGEGIAPDFLPHVFKPFEQAADPGGAWHGGLGIGLALSRSLVEIHGGEIRAESEGLGRGARFTFWIPLAPAGAPGLHDGSGAAVASDHDPAREPTRLRPGRFTRVGSEAIEAAQSASGGPPYRLEARPSPLARRRRQRVLIVEDNADTLEAMRILLASWEYEVIATESAGAALEEASRTTPDVIISDIGMPHVDGLAFARRFRAEADASDRTLLIAITGFASTADRRRALEAGFDAYLTKPINFASLRALLESAPPPVLEPLEA